GVFFLIFDDGFGDDGVGVVHVLVADGEDGDGLLGAAEVGLGVVELVVAREDVRRRRARREGPGVGVGRVVLLRVGVGVVLVRGGTCVTGPRVGSVVVHPAIRTIAAATARYRTPPGMKRVPRAGERGATIKLS
ncbi:MAG: hypothetical protein AAFU58_04240, partial [Pseudomonadota bacterium]